MLKCCGGGGGQNVNSNDFTLTMHDGSKDTNVAKSQNICESSSPRK